MNANVNPLNSPNRVNLQQHYERFVGRAYAAGADVGGRREPSFSDEQGFVVDRDMRANVSWSGMKANSPWATRAERNAASYQGFASSTTPDPVGAPAGLGYGPSAPPTGSAPVGGWEFSDPGLSASRGGDSLIGSAINYGQPRPPLSYKKIVEKSQSDKGLRAWLKRMAEYFAKMLSQIFSKLFGRKIHMTASEFAAYEAANSNEAEAVKQVAEDVAEMPLSQVLGDPRTGSDFAAMLKASAQPEELSKLSDETLDYGFEMGAKAASVLKSNEEACAEQVNALMRAGAHRMNMRPGVFADMYAMHAQDADPSALSMLDPGGEIAGAMRGLESLRDSRKNALSLLASTIEEMRRRGQNVDQKFSDFKGLSAAVDVRGVKQAGPSQDVASVPSDGAAPSEVNPLKNETMEFAALHTAAKSLDGLSALPASLVQRAGDLSLFFAQQRLVEIQLLEQAIGKAWADKAADRGESPEVLAQMHRLYASQGNDAGMASLDPDQAIAALQAQVVVRRGELNESFDLLERVVLHLRANPAANESNPAMLSAYTKVLQEIHPKSVVFAPATPESALQSPAQSAQNEPLPSNMVDNVSQTSTVDVAKQASGAFSPKENAPFGGAVPGFVANRETPKKSFKDLAASLEHQDGPPTYFDDSQSHRGG